MIKKIPLSELKSGMYVHDLNCSWHLTPIRHYCFRISNEQQIEEVRALGAREVYIDTTLGDDLPGAPTEDEVRRELEEEMAELATRGEIAVHHHLASRDELEAALATHNIASQLIQGMMTDVRLGQQIEFDAISEALSGITEGILGSFGPLMQLGQLKNQDDYTFQHCVGVCALLTAFGKTLELSRQALSDLGVGGLMHDVGKMRVPMGILNKPGRLTEGEFDEIKQHVAYGCEIIKDAPWVSNVALQVLQQHHERYDGTGYPDGLNASEISPVGQMAAIVDVYDALTAHRVYHKGITPAEALRKLQEWSRFHFNQELVGHFIRSLGIYPVRTLVRLESGLLGIVIDQNPADLLRPVLIVVYDTVANSPRSPYRLDLKNSASDRILNYQLPEDYGIDVDRHLMVN